MAEDFEQIPERHPHLLVSVLIEKWGHLVEGVATDSDHVYALRPEGIDVYSERWGRSRDIPANGATRFVRVAGT